MPGPGPGLGWFEIDELGFDEQFWSVLALLSSVLTLVGIVIFRPFMANNSIAKIIVILFKSLGMLYQLLPIYTNMKFGENLMLMRTICGEWQSF